MHTQESKTKENNCKAVANSIFQRKAHTKQAYNIIDNRPEAITQRKIQEIGNKALQKKNINSSINSNSVKPNIVQFFRDYFAWGSANTTPHVHVYNGGMHLKTAGGQRFNIVQNGSKHAQADDALLNVQGKGNKKLRQTIKHTARDKFGIEL